MTRPIVFLSDYGLEDGFVGVCHSVIAGIAPDARVIDLSHLVPPQDVRRGALVLEYAAPYLPAGAVILAVVDPGVGSGRRAVAVEAGGRALVGPDKGLLSLAWEALGGAERAVELTERAFRLDPVSATFHGRDVFAPAAAHLASGVVLDQLGPALDPGSLRTVELPEPEIGDGVLSVTVLFADRFGNLILSARAGDLEAAGLVDATDLSIGSRAVHRGRTFSDVPSGGSALIEDSTGRLALVVNGGSAADRFALAADQRISLTRGSSVG